MIVKVYEGALYLRVWTLAVLYKGLSLNNQLSRCLCGTLLEVAEVLVSDGPICVRFLKTFLECLENLLGVLIYHSCTATPQRSHRQLVFPLPSSSFLTTQCSHMLLVTVFCQLDLPPLAMVTLKE